MLTIFIEVQLKLCSVVSTRWSHVEKWKQSRASHLTLTPLSHNPYKNGNIKHIIETDSGIESEQR